MSVGLVAWTSREQVPQCGSFTMAMGMFGVDVRVGRLDDDAGGDFRSRRQVAARVLCSSFFGSASRMRVSQWRLGLGGGVCVMGADVRGTAYCRPLRCIGTCSAELYYPLTLTAVLDFHSEKSILYPSDRRTE